MSKIKSRPAQRGVERRSPNRPPDPPCPMCGAPPGEARVTVRTSYVFFKCGNCGHIWEMEMPKEYRFKWLRK